MALERGGVVPGLVAERGAESLDPAAVAHQHVPVVMPDLVAEMAEQGAVGLVHARTAPLEFGRIGFGERDRHHAVVVARHHLRPGVLRRIGQEFEGEAVLRILGPGLQRQPPAQEAVEQPVLGEFHLPPRGRHGRRSTGRDRVVVPAGAAKPVRRGRGDQPVAGV